MKSREFDNALDECLERLLIKGETIEQCLQSFPEHADTLKPLLETALAIKKASDIQPRPELKDRARYQFHSALQGMEPKKHYPIFGWQPRWAMAVAIVLVLLLAGGGTVAAAGGSMPDEPLYPVKLATEQVQLILTPSALGKAELYTKLADRRVLEIAHIAGENKPEQIEQTAQRLNTYLTRIADLASTEEVTGGVAMAPAAREAPAVEEALTTEEAPTPKEALAVEKAPAAERAPAAKRALTAKEAPAAKRALTGKEALAVEKAPAAKKALAVEKAPLLPEQAKEVKGARISADRRARLRVTVVRYAVSHPARLRALLKTAPESAKPALRRAIAISEAGYEQAIKALD